MPDSQPAVNTDRELWREIPGDFYSPSIFVTEGGCIGINCDGTVSVLPIREWHAMAQRSTPRYVDKAVKIVAQLQEWIENRDGLSTTHIAYLDYARDTLQIGIGPFIVYCDQEGGDMTFEACQDAFLRAISDLSPFIPEAMSHFRRQIQVGIDVIESATDEVRGLNKQISAVIEPKAPA